MSNSTKEASLPKESAIKAIEITDEIIKILEEKCDNYEMVNFVLGLLNDSPIDIKK